MTSKEIVLDIMRQQGRSDAVILRQAAVDMTGTQIIAQERKIPLYDGMKDYSEWPVGAPVQYDGQDYALIQPHNASHFAGQTPATLPALWRVLHTTDPAKAKPWVRPTSTSDLYRAGDCMLWTDGAVYRSLRDTNYSPYEYAADWEVVP